VTIAAVERALKVLEALSGEPDGVDLSLLAERLDLPASATHRLLATLAERGFVAQDPASGAYGLTLKLSQLAFRNLDLRGLPDAGQIVLDGLAVATREYCRLAVVEGESLVWIARAQGATAGLRYEPPMGTEIVLHATATGKAWLASLPEAEALRIVCARGFRADGRTGPNALQDVDALRAHLDQTRRRGVALAVEEGEIGTVAMATTFRAGPDSDAPVAGTLSVAGPAARMSESRHGEITEALRQAARAMAEVWPLRRRQIQSLVPAVAGGEPRHSLSSGHSLAAGTNA
jgi:DNA-binding IclR family transcriptional regulator